MGNVTKEVKGDITTDYTYNLGNFVTSMTTKRNNSVISTHSYTYNADGNIAKSVDNGITKNYTYDPMNRLVGEVTDDEQYYYEYDLAGNRSKLTATGSENFVTSYSYDKNNRLLEERAVYDSGNQNIINYYYDNNGNTRTKKKSVVSPSTAQASLGIKTANELPQTQSSEYFTFDVFNQLKQYKKTDGTTAVYSYLPNGYRYSKSVNGKVTNFIWDGDNIALEYGSGSTEPTNVYYRDRNGKVILDETSLSYIYNAHGDVTSILNNSGTKTKEYEYNAFGVVDSETNTSTYNPWQYCGEYRDEESGLIYLRNRYYDPSNGRFINEDPAKDGLNWYAYCEGNPVMFWDPSGLANTYIFYNEADQFNGSLGDRANKRAEQLKAEGKTVEIKMISSATQFKEEWDKMDNDGLEIELVELFFHMNPQAIIMKNEPLVTESRNYQEKCVHINELAKKSINTIILNGCNSAHQDHSNTNVAFEFTKYQNVKNVFGWDGSMKWSILTGKPILNSGTDYFTSWLNNGKREELGFIKYTKSFGTITVHSNIYGKTLDINNLKNIKNYKFLNAYDLTGKPIYYEETEGIA